MRVVWTPHAREDSQHWQDTDRATVKRVHRLIEDCVRDPFSGIGKPEPLCHALGGLWSRRIDGEHRLVYDVNDDDLVILQARFHYE